MAAYDHGGGCPCGLYRECDPGCREYKDNYRMLKMNEKKPYAESATRPWGEWRVLDVDQGYKIKRLEILPDQSISLQYHVHRSEHWTIVQGEGRVIVDGSIFNIKKGESFHIPKMSLHKISNNHLTETLIAIEVQMGEICSEDDIVRC
jgi:mannose-6-phosphate isomerase